MAHWEISCLTIFRWIFVSKTGFHQLLSLNCQQSTETFAGKTWLKALILKTCLINGTLGIITLINWLIVTKMLTNMNQSKLTHTEHMTSVRAPSQALCRSHHTPTTDIESTH